MEDPLFDKAWLLFVEYRGVSPSFLARKLQISVERAKELVEKVYEKEMSLIKKS